MRNHRTVTRVTADLERLKGFGHRTDLIHLDQSGVGDTGAYPGCDQLGVGHEIVVTDQLHPIAKSFSQFLPAAGVVLAHPVFDAPHRKPFDDARIAVDQLVAGQRLPAQPIAAITVEFTGGRVQRDGYTVAPGGVAGSRQ